MTRFAIIASVALAATYAVAAPAPFVPHERDQNNQVGNWNWNGQQPNWYTERSGVRTSTCNRAHTRHHTKWYHTRTKTRTATAPTATSVAAPAPTSVETTVAPVPTSTEAPVQTSSVPLATSTVVPTTTAAPTTAAPTTAAAPATTASTSKASEGSSGNTEIDAYLKGHNDMRAKHGASPLTWADDLAAAAAKWAENCVWEHSKGKVGAFGENLAAGTGLGAAAAVKMWNDEESEYNPANPQYSHFTQVVWKATTEVGCAVRSCNNLLSGYSGAVNFHVCEYRKPGNVIGQFAQNVQV